MNAWLQRPYCSRLLMKLSISKTSAPQERTTGPVGHVILVSIRIVSKMAVALPMPLGRKLMRIMWRCVEVRLC